MPKSKWISVYKKLPPVGKEVLVCAVVGRLAIDYRYSNADEVAPTEFCNYSVAFWQPLPSRPEEFREN